MSYVPRSILRTSRSRSGRRTGRPISLGRRSTSRTPRHNPLSQMISSGASLLQPPVIAPPVLSYVNPPRSSRRVTFGTSPGLRLDNITNQITMSSGLQPQLLNQTYGMGQTYGMSQPYGMGQPSGVVLNTAETYGYNTLELDRILDHIENDKLISQIEIDSPVGLIEDSKDTFIRDPEEGKLFIETYRLAVEQRSF